MQEAKQNSGLIDFIRIACKDFMHTGTIFPSSHSASLHIASKIPAQQATHIVEYGSGNGSLTKALLQRLQPHGYLYAIEINREFVDLLQQIKDERLHVVNANVDQISSRLQTLCPDGVDAVVSGIPFSFLNSEQRERIVENTFAGLNPGGLFVVYQNSPAMLSLLRKHFKKVSWQLEPRNLPPYFIMVATKAA